jgi:hypothetical protein
MIWASITASIAAPSGGRYPCPASQSAEGNGSRTYLQVSRNGILEAVEAALLNGRNKLNGRHPFIPGFQFEDEIPKALPRFFEVQKQLGVEPPLFIMLSLLGVRGYVIAPPHRNMSPFTHYYPIDKNELVVPEIMIEDFECDSPSVMRPAFDAVWNAAGWPRSMNYSDSGERITT